MDRLINPPWRRKREIWAVQPFAGRGLLSIFSKIIPYAKKAFKWLFPVAKKVVTNPTVRKTAGKIADAAIDTGIDLVSDTVKKKNPGENLNKNVDKVKDAFVDGVQSFKSENRSRKKEETASQSNGKKRKASSVKDIEKVRTAIRSGSSVRKRKKRKLFSN